MNKFEKPTVKLVELANMEPITTSNGESPKDSILSTINKLYPTQDVNP